LRIEDEGSIVGAVTPVTLVVGIILILFALFLYFLEKFKPGYKRESDVVYASMALGLGILSLIDFGATFTHSLQTAVFTGVFIALALEAINARTPDNSPMKQSGGGPRDDDRNPRNYRAGFEESNYTPMDDRGSRRQMRDGRGGRDEYESRSPGRNDRDRFLEDRPRRQSRYDQAPPGADMGRESRPGRDEFGDDVRSIPDRTSGSDPMRGRDRGDRPGMDRPMDRPSSDRSNMDDVPRPRRRPMDDEAPAPRRSGRPPVDDVAPSDYVEFRPVEPIPPKESWGPKE
jgi:Ycf66 protein N-terminus